MHYFQFNIGEYASHTRHLSPIEDIAYRRLLDLAYTTELPLTKDLRLLTRLINLREHSQEVEDVLKEFFYEAEDGWVNNRVIKEIEKTGKKSEAAKNSAAVRWENERKAKRMQQQCEHDANASNNNANASKNDATNNPLPNTQDPLPNTNNPTPNTQDQKHTPLAMLMALGVTKKSAQDWLKVRARKKMELTDDALELLKRECLKANLTPAEAIKKCNEQSWAGFKASWLEKEDVGKSPQYQSAGQRRIENTNKAVAEFLGNENQENVIEGEYQHA